MWPDLMGPGWPWHVVATAGMMAALLTLVALVARAAVHEEPASPDPLMVLWHRYEVGDLTRREFERLRTALTRHTPVRQALWTRPPAMDPAVRRALNGNARPAKRGAAAGAKG